MCSPFSAAININWFALRHVFHLCPFPLSTADIQPRLAAFGITPSSVSTCLRTPALTRPPRYQDVDVFVACGFEYLFYFIFFARGTDPVA